jgi:5-methylcytosine-specific restriction endonuclease McrA
MHLDPSTLDTKTLAECLRASAIEERDRQVDFLRYLDPFDAREAWRELGYHSLWHFCLRELGLREGAAGRRIGAMRALRDFPRLEAPLRDGRLSLTTLVTLRPVLTESNLDDVIERAALKTDEEARDLVALLQPKAAPREGIRRLPGSLRPVAAPTASAPVEPEPQPTGPIPGGEGAHVSSPLDPVKRLASAAAVPVVHWSLRVTIDAAFRADLEVLKSLLGHKIPNGDLSAVLHEAVRCGIEKHGKRRGAVKPGRTRSTRSSPRPGDRAHVPAPVRREVWARDGGRCTFVSEDGRRCECRTKLELDHVDPRTRGRVPTAADLRLACRPHNIFWAEQAYGREFMSRFRKERGPREVGQDAIAGDGARRTRRASRRAVSDAGP